MKIDQVELRLIELPFRRPFKTSFGTETKKTTIVAIVRADGVAGYGETVMERLPLYREETIAGAWELMTKTLGPDLLAQPLDHPEELAGRWQCWRGNQMAKAGLELAVWDCYARQLGKPLHSLIGGVRTKVPVGASLGIDSAEATLESVGAHVDQGYQRIKLKIEPGWDRQVLVPVREQFPEIELSVDANGAYTLTDRDLLASFDEFGLHYLEQPLHFDDLVDHAELGREIDTAICLDESLTSPARVRAAVELRATKVVNVKVGRVGGLQAVREIHVWCTSRGVPLWCGGMLETGIGRAHNIHLATMPGFVYPGDTASASRTYDRDLVEQPLEAVDGEMAVPEGPGIGVTVDQTFLEKVTRRTKVIGG